MHRDGNPTGNRTHISYPDYMYYILKMMTALEGHLDKTNQIINAPQIYDALARRSNARDKLIAELTWILITYFFTYIMSLARRRERKVLPAVELERADEKTANPSYIVGGLPTLMSSINGPCPCSGNSAKQKRCHIQKLLEDLDRLTFDKHTSSEDLIADLKSQNALPPLYQPPDIHPLDRDELSNTARHAAQQRKRGTLTNTTTPKVQTALRTTPGVLILNYVAVLPLRKHSFIQKPPSLLPIALSEDNASPRASPTLPVGDGSHRLVDIHGNMQPEITLEYPIAVQAMIPCALSALHSYIRIHDPWEHDSLDLGDGVRYDPRNAPDKETFNKHTYNSTSVPQAERNRADARRDRIAQELWED
ncbi:hypothetical protein FB107DRAFT_280797 [Schizophyllum commune]